MVGACPKEAAPTGSPETVLSKATFAIFASVVVLYVTCTASSGEASSGDPYSCPSEEASPPEDPHATANTVTPATIMQEGPRQITPRHRMRADGLILVSRYTLPPSAAAP